MNEANGSASGPSSSTPALPGWPGGCDKEGLRHRWAVGSRGYRIHSSGPFSVSFGAVSQPGPPAEMGGRGPTPGIPLPKSLPQGAGLLVVTSV